MQVCGFWKRLFHSNLSIYHDTISIHLQTRHVKSSFAPLVAFSGLQLLDWRCGSWTLIGLLTSCMMFAGSLIESLHAASPPPPPPPPPGLGLPDRPALFSGTTNVPSSVSFSNDGEGEAPHHCCRRCWRQNRHHSRKTSSFYFIHHKKQTIIPSRWSSCGMGLIFE